MKTLGEGVTEDECRLESIARRIPAWQDSPLRYAPVGGGISNTNWRVDVERLGASYFCKVPGAGTEMFIDRRTALDASLKAAATGYGVPVYAFLEDCGVQIFDFMEGWHASSNRDFLQRDIRHNALQALKAFHQQPLLVQDKTVFDMIDEHDAQVAALQARVPQDHAWLQACYRRARAALEAAGMTSCPCMNDTLAGNFMLDARGAIKLVDFEYASNNDPHYELALWFGEMFFDETTEHELVEAYFGAVRPATLARIALNKALADLKWSTWAMVQRALSTIDFDYYKYGIWKHMRARSLMRDPRWDGWLRQV
ncbi:MAG: phosphotransferase [Janthinobacterium lividum]